MVRRWVGSGAFATSVAAHLLVLSCGTLVLSHSLRDRAREREAARLKAPAEFELELPRFDPSASDDERESEPAYSQPEPPPAGGGPVQRHPDTEQAGRGGSRTAPLSATNLASHIDPINLEPDQLTHLDRSQVQRLHTASERRSWDDHRSTPNPMQLTFLATGAGSVRERRSPGNAARGSVAGAVATPLGGAPGSRASEDGASAESPRGAAVPGSQQAEPLRGALSAARGVVPSGGASVLLARPSVMRARPALPTEARARPSDTDDSSEAVAARVAALIHASTIGAPPGPGVGGEPTGGRPGRSGNEGMGSHSRTGGFAPGPDVTNDPGLQGFFASLKQRVNDQLLRAFPDWAIEQGRSGHVIFELALLADGRLERVRMVRPSGIDEFDGNVLNGVRRIASFGPVPKALLPKGIGQPALITMSFVALNHVIGRQGPGPGGYGAAHQTQ